jgi:tetratricopeptide (TPR) repeat protein
MMEESNEPRDEKELNPNLCVNCQQVKYEEAYTFKLCTECRTSLVNFPIPKWIYGTAAVLMIIIIIGIARTPGNFMAAMSLSRGEKALEEHRYKTAERELKQTLDLVPNSLLAEVNLMIVYAYTLDQQKFIPIFQKIGEKDIEDKELYGRVTDALNYYGSIYSIDTSFYTRLQQAGNSVPLIESTLDSNMKNFPNDYASIFLAADKLYDLGEYGKSGKLLVDILKERENYRPALQLLIAIKRNEKKCDSAMTCCDRLLALNVEDESTIAQKAKIELKRKNDKQAVEYVKMAMDIDSNSVYSLEAKAMVQYFSDDRTGSNLTLNKIIALESAENHVVSERVSKIITGKEIYR